MEKLKVLIKLLSAQKVRQIEIISEDINLSEKSNQLYSGIKEGKFLSDLDAAQKLYNSDEKNPTYRQLKHRLKQRLINTIFFIDVQAYSSNTYQKILNKAFKNWAASKILFDKGLRSTAISLMETILKNSLKYDLTELSLLILKDLKMHYGIYNYNAYKYEKYKTLYSEISEVFTLREKAETLFTELGHIVETKKSVGYTQTIQSMEKEIESLLKKSNDIDSYYLKYYLFNAAYFVLLIKKDFEAQLALTNKACDYFEKKTEFKRVAIFSFTQFRGISLLSLGYIDRAIHQFKDTLKFSPKEGSVSWQSIQKYLFACYILSKDYNTAYKVISDMMNHKAFANVNKDFKQHWFLKEAFIQFLIRIKKINPDNLEAKKLRPFRINRFLNEIPELAKDKRGYNVAVHIIQMLFLIIDEKYDLVLNKLSALNQYNFRYLKRPEYSRSSLFIKMILKIPDGDYNAEKIKIKAKKFHQKLLNTPMDFSEQSMNIEIIPYEQLWEEILGIFEKKRAF